MRRASWLGVWGAVSALLFAYLGYGQRWIHDDGFINLRIVRNVVAGDGPVFNLGERVEVGTSPLWLALLAIVHGFGARPEDAALGLGIVLSVIAVGVLPFASARPVEPSRGVWIPVGLLVFGAVPATWQYATSGLETGLACAWIATSSIGVVRAMRPKSGFGHRAIVATWVGMGPLVRPDFLVYTALFLGVILWRERRSRPWRLVLLFSAAFATPLVVQGLRMGYYGTLGPNTALAKEAFRTNVPQGMCYLRTFLAPYWLPVPLVPLLFFTGRRIDAIGRHDKYGAAATAAPVVGALVHTGYLVTIGGDYMHARLLLPDMLALVIPTAVVLVPTRARSLPSAIQLVFGGLVVAWAPLCAFFLRPSAENQCGIGDEHGWYVREAHRFHPVRIEHYARHPFYAEREPVASSTAPRTLFTGRDTSLLAPEVDSRIERAVLRGAIGIVGYSLPSSVHVIDEHGLADPVGARFEVDVRGRPGHEKRLSTTWALARFAAPTPEDESDVVAARAALGCGDAKELLDSARAPLDLSRFSKNAARSFAHQRLRIPTDPFVALARLCDQRALRREVRGDAGGTPFTWMCAAGSHAIGARVHQTAEDKSIAAVALVCSGASRAEKAFGERKGQGISLACAVGARLVGFFGTVDRSIQGVGLVCTQDGQRSTTSVSGSTRGRPFEVTCSTSQRVGLAGRSGTVVNALGVACAE